MSLDACFALLATCPETSPLEQAIWGGAHVDRLGYAFVAGYSAALARMFPGAPARSALAVTEAGGNHPRAIATRLADGKLTGEKTFVSLGSSAETVFVLAHDGRRLVVARVDPRTEGVTLVDRAPLPFAPEIPHATMTLAGVAPLEVLPGDGYDTYVRAFRTVEDVHVLGAALGYVTETFERDAAAEALALLAALRQIEGKLSSPTTHLVVAGVFRAARRIAEGAPRDPIAAERWVRDRGLLAVAEAVRAKRTEKAWQEMENARRS